MSEQQGSPAGGTFQDETTYFHYRRSSDGSLTAIDAQRQIVRNVPRIEANLTHPERSPRSERRGA